MLTYHCNNLQVVFHDDDVHQFDLAELKSCKSNVSMSGVPGRDFVASCLRHFVSSRLLQVHAFWRNHSSVDSTRHVFHIHLAAHSRVV